MPLANTFSALADPTRRAILEHLAQGEQPVGALLRRFDISGPAISRHLKILEAAKLIENRRVGKGRMCRLNEGSLTAARDWMDFQARFWGRSFDRLEKFIAERDENE